MKIRSTASLGSVSSGTHREEDLLPAFYGVLEFLCAQHRRVRGVGKYREVIKQAKAAERLLEKSSHDPGNGDKWEIISTMINETLPDALQDFSPPFCYFGTHEGDGADFGFWFSHDDFQTQVSDGRVFVRATDPWSKEEILPMAKRHPEVNYFAFYNDHGNLTVWNREAKTVLEVV